MGGSRQKMRGLEPRRISNAERAKTAVGSGAASTLEVAQTTGLTVRESAVALTGLMRRGAIIKVIRNDGTAYYVPQQPRPAKRRLSSGGKPAETVYLRDREDGPRDRGTPEMRALRKRILGSPAAVGELCCPVDFFSSLLGQEAVWAGHRIKVIYAHYARTRIPKHMWPLPWWWQLEEAESSSAIERYEDLCAGIKSVVRVFHPGSVTFPDAVLRELRRIAVGQWPVSVANLKIGLHAAAIYLGIRWRDDIRVWRAPR